MNDIKFIVIGGAVVISGLVGFGIYSSQSMKNDNSESKTIVNSTGGDLTVTETPVEDIKSDDLKSQEINNNDNKNMNKVTIDTTMGKIVLELYREDAPKTVENFVSLIKKGFYDGVIFHRVINGFMIQGGDPTGTGTGGPGYQFADELDKNKPSAKVGYKKGVLAMANAGPNTNGSQFFIMHADRPLEYNYTIFGRVIEGQDVVDAIGKVKTDPNDKPITPVVMKSVTVGE